MSMELKLLGGKVLVPPPFIPTLTRLVFSMGYVPSGEAVFLHQESALVSSDCSKGWT